MLGSHPLTEARLILGEVAILAMTYEVLEEEQSRRLECADGMRGIADLGTRGPGLRPHRLEHLCGHDDRDAKRQGAPGQERCLGAGAQGEPAVIVQPAERGGPDVKAGAVQNGDHHAG